LCGLTYAVGRETFRFRLALVGLAILAVIGGICAIVPLIVPESAANQVNPLLFRAPYGARNKEIIDRVTSEGLRSMMWTIDSLDWADPIPESIAMRVLHELNQRQKGIVLFQTPFDRGWQAWQNGQATPVLKVDAGLLGVGLDAGEHKIELRYRNPVLIPALAITLASFLILAAGLWRWPRLGLSQRSHPACGYQSRLERFEERRRGRLPGG
jgi:hypothetical protein